MWVGGSEYVYLFKLKVNYKGIGILDLLCKVKFLIRDLKCKLW